MPEATVELPSGAKVRVEGTEEEVNRILRELVIPATGRKQKRAGKKGGQTPPKTGQAVAGYVLELREAGQFDKPKGLTDIKEALSSEGHIVPITTLSGVMLRLARSKELRRFKENGTWKYVKR